MLNDALDNEQKFVFQVINVAFENGGAIAFTQYVQPAFTWNAVERSDFHICLPTNLVCETISRHTIPNRFQQFPKK